MHLNIPKTLKFIPRKWKTKSLLSKFISDFKFVKYDVPRIYLNELPSKFNSAEIIMYADDTTIINTANSLAAFNEIQNTSNKPSLTCNKNQDILFLLKKKQSHVLSSCETPWS